MWSQKRQFLRISISILNSRLDPTLVEFSAGRVKLDSARKLARSFFLAEYPARYSTDPKNPTRCITSHPYLVVGVSIYLLLRLLLLVRRPARRLLLAVGLGQLRAGRGRQLIRRCWYVELHRLLRSATSVEGQGGGIIERIKQSAPIYPYFRTKGIPFWDRAFTI